MADSTVYLSTAYLAPVQYYCKLYQYRQVAVEAMENFSKQTYRNRCNIAGANGIQALSVPVEKSETLKILTRDVCISDHGNWRHLHWQALVSAYHTTPFFEYYQDDFAPFYEKKYDFLLDFNEALRQMISSLIGVRNEVTYTESYQPEVSSDFREAIRPKHPVEDATFRPVSYYQVFQERWGFLPNLSIVDLLFNMGPESLIVLRQSIPAP